MAVERPSQGADITGPVNRGRRRFLGMAATTFAALPSHRVGVAEVNQREPPLLKALSRATTWLHSPPLSVEALRGKPMLVQFGTYTCINWLRTLPHVRAWHRKYGQRLVLVGVHTPEFTFEHDLAYARPAVAGLRLGFPVAVDNDYAIWRAFGNHYWPALYFIDAHGRVRGQHFGEGEYEHSEGAIRKLLHDSGVTVEDTRLMPVALSGVELQADWRNLKSPELYLGHRRTRNFSSPGGGASRRRRSYTAPTRLSSNAWALVGDWTIADEACTLNKATGRIVCRFHARDAHLVMGSPHQEQPVRVRVAIDGQPPGPAHGEDIDASGDGSVAEPRLYQLIRQPGPVVDRTVEIEFLDAGAQVFAFTFG